MTTAYVNRIATAVPPHDVHSAFLSFAQSLFPDNPTRAALFQRMAQKSGIEHRYSFVAPGADPAGAVIDQAAFYVRGDFPTTAARMRFFETHAPELAAATVERLLRDGRHDDITHLLITCCTGVSAPGLDLELVERCRLPGSVERTVLGFMGCYAAINALRLARHIVRSEAARGSSSSASSFARCISRRRPISKLSCRSCCGATAAPQHWSPPSRMA